MAKNKKTVEGLFKAKQERRKALSQLPPEEKVKILVQLQKMAIPILAARGLKKTAWKI